MYKETRDLLQVRYIIWNYIHDDGDTWALLRLFVRPLIHVETKWTAKLLTSGPTFIKPDQRNPWIKDQLGNDLLSTILHL